MITGLIDWLRFRREHIVRCYSVLEERWDPTYGPGDPGTVTIEVVDFDRLLDEIDAFQNQLRNAS